MASGHNSTSSSIYPSVCKICQKDFTSFKTPSENCRTHLRRSGSPRHKQWLSELQNTIHDRSQQRERARLRQRALRSRQASNANNEQVQDANVPDTAGAIIHPDKIASKKESLKQEWKKRRETARRPREPSPPVDVAVMKENPYWLLWRVIGFCPPGKPKDVSWRDWYEHYAEVLCGPVQNSTNGEGVPEIFKRYAAAPAVPIMPPTYTKNEIFIADNSPKINSRDPITTIESETFLSAAQKWRTGKLMDHLQWASEWRFRGMSTKTQEEYAKEKGEYDAEAREYESLKPDMMQAWIDKGISKWMDKVRYKHLEQDHRQPYYDVNQEANFANDALSRPQSLGGEEEYAYDTEDDEYHDEDDEMDGNERGSDEGEKDVSNMIEEMMHNPSLFSAL